MLCSCEASVTFADWLPAPIRIAVGSVGPPVGPENFVMPGGGAHSTLLHLFSVGRGDVATILVLIVWQCDVATTRCRRCGRGRYSRGEIAIPLPFAVRSPTRTTYQGTFYILIKTRMSRYLRS